MLEVTHHPLGRFLQPAQMTDGGLLQVALGPGRGLAGDDGLEVGVEHLIGVQFRTVSGQVKDLDLIAMVSQLTDGRSFHVLGLELQNENVAVGTLVVIFAIGFVLFCKADKLNNTIS